MATKAISTKTTVAANPPPAPVTAPPKTPQGPSKAEISKSILAGVANLQAEMKECDGRLSEVSGYSNYVNPNFADRLYRTGTRMQRLSTSLIALDPKNAQLVERLQGDAADVLFMSGKLKAAGERGEAYNQTGHDWSTVLDRALESLQMVIASLN